MIIKWTDNGILECHKIEFCGTDLLADEIYIIPIDEIENIED